MLEDISDICKHVAKTINPHPNCLSHVLTKYELTKVYNKIGTMLGTAKHFGCSIFAIETYLKKYGIAYKKQVKYSCDEEAFLHDTQEAFYWAGFMAADGNLCDERYLRIKLAKKDIDQIEKFKLFVKTDAKIYIIKKYHKRFLAV